MKRARWFDKLTMNGGGLLTTCLIAALLLAGLSSAGIANAVEFGANWSEEGSNALPAARTNHTSLTFDDQLWVIGGHDGVSASEKVYSSSDGATWAEVGTDVLPAPRSGHCSVVFGGKMWVLGGTDLTNRYDNVYSSSDGSTWAEEGTDALPADLSSHACVVANSKIYIFGGEDAAVPGGVSEKVYSSSDGITWTEEGTDALPVALQGLKASFFNNAFYLTGGRKADLSVVDTVYRSSDAQSWTQVGALPGVRYLHASVAADGQLWVTGGTNVTSKFQTVFSSVDGETWVTVGNDPLPLTIAEHGLAFWSGKIYLTGGKNNGTPSRKVFSTDDIAGAAPLSQPVDQAAEFANEIPAVDQSADTANSDLPILELAAAEEAETGWPLVDLTLILGFLIVASLVAFTLARLAPDNKLLAALGVMGVLAIGFAVGQEAIPWYVFLAAGGLMFGITSLGSAVQG